MANPRKLAPNEIEYLRWIAPASLLREAVVQDISGQLFINVPGWEPTTAELEKMKAAGFVVVQTSSKELAPSAGDAEAEDSSGPQWTGVLIAIGVVLLIALVLFLVVRYSASAAEWAYQHTKDSGWKGSLARLILKLTKVQSVQKEYLLPGTVVRLVDLLDNLDAATYAAFDDGRELRSFRRVGVRPNLVLLNFYNSEDELATVTSYQVVGSENIPIPVFETQEGQLEWAKVVVPVVGDRVSAGDHLKTVGEL